VDQRAKAGNLLNQAWQQLHSQVIHSTAEQSGKSALHNPQSASSNPQKSTFRNRYNRHLQKPFWAC
jgi:hypothetical protein